MKEHPSYEPNGTSLLPELGERDVRIAPTWTRTGETLHPHGLLACQEGNVAPTSEKPLLVRGK